MPAVSAPNLAHFRTEKHRTKLYLAVYHPISMWTARVSGNHTARATAITVSGAAGTTPVANYEVWFSAVGYDQMDMGRGRVKSLGGSTLNIAPNNFDLAGNEYITVKQNIIPAAVQPRVSTTVYEDWDTPYAANQNLQYRPLARMGSPACAFIDANTGLATIQFWSDAEAIVGALASFLWTVPSGTFAVGNATTAGTALVPNVVTWNAAGQYWCSLRVTDSNNNTHTTYRPVFIFDARGGTQPYTQVEIQSLEGNQDSGGWTCGLTVRGTADRAAFPELAQVVLFAEDWYDDTKISIGGDYTWRENIVFVGFIRQGSVKAHAWNQTVEFQAAGAGVILEDLPGYAFDLASAATPAGWHELSAMTYKLAAYHIITEHSTLALIADVDLAPVAYTAARMSFVQSSLKDQVANQCIAPVRFVFGSSRLGRLYARQQPQLVAAAARTEAIVLDTADADIRDQVDIATEAIKKTVAQTDFQAFNFNASNESQPVLSLAPGTPWDSGRFDQTSGIRVTDQADGNIVSGYCEGRANNSYPDITIRWRGNYRVFDVFPPEKLRLNLTAAQNNRGLAWTNQVVWHKRVSIQYKPGILLTESQCEKDVVGQPGITGNYPIEPPGIGLPPPPPPIIEPPPVPPPVIPPGRGNLLYLATLRGVAKCEAAYAGAPYWTAINSGLGSAAAKTIRGFNLDPWSLDPTGDHFQAAWAMTQDGLYRCAGLPNAASWSQQLTDAAASALLSKTVGLSGSFTPAVRLAGLIICGAIENLGTGYYKLYVIYSLDYGATWNGDNAKYITFDPGLGQSAYAAPTFIASYHLDSTYYVAMRNGPINNQTYPGGFPAPGRVILMRSTALPTFEPIASYDTPFKFGGNFVFPYCNPGGTAYADDNIAFIYNVIFDSAERAIRRYTNLLNPPFSPGYAPPVPVNRGDATMLGNPGHTIAFPFVHMFNADRVVSFTSVGGYNSAGRDLWTSLTGGTAWTMYPSLTISGRLIKSTNLFQIPINQDAFFVVGQNQTLNTGAIIVAHTQDYGATFTDISNYGGANALDTVLGLSGGDADGAFIIVDYWKT